MVYLFRFVTFVLTNNYTANMKVYISFLNFLSTIVVLLFIASCGSDDSAPPLDEETDKVDSLLHSIVPAKSFPGLTVTIHGGGFNTTKEKNEVFFNGTTAMVREAFADSLVVNVPDKGSSGPVTVKTDGVFKVNSLDFEYYDFPEPVIYNRCDTGSVNLAISDFQIYRMEEKTISDTGEKYYVFYYSFTIENTGSEEADLTDNYLQNYFSTDATEENEIGAGGGSNRDRSMLAPGESIEISGSGNSSVLPEKADLHGKFLLVSMIFSAEGCTDLVAQEIVLPK